MKPKVSITLLYFSLIVVFVVVINLVQHSLRDSKKIRKQAQNKNVLIEASFTPVLPTLESIFSNDHSWTGTLSAEKVTTILVTGDIIPARSVNASVISRNDPLWPYAKVAPKIAELAADLTFINLETPLIKNCPVTVEGMIFCGNVQNIEGLKEIGADVVSVANNHFGNYGKSGIDETLELLNSAGMTAAGIGNPVYVRVNGTNFAFLAFNDIEKQKNGINPAEEDFIRSNIKAARSNADIVVVMYHWGAEYRSIPDERQKTLAHFTVDNGADLVVSNHPHWIQPLEFYKGKVIMYAHGNFIFDQMWSEQTRLGVLGLYTFYDQQLIDIEFFPLKIYDYGQPVFLEGKEKQKILNQMEDLSSKIY